MNQIISKNPRHGQRGPQRDGSSEENWRNNNKSHFGDNFAQKICQFDRLDKDSFKDLNKRLKDFMKEQSDQIGSSRIRKLYDIVKGARNETQLLLVMPRLAYVVGRIDRMQEKDAVGQTVSLLADAIEQMKSKEDYRGIQQFAEAIVAYQKFYSNK